MSISYPLSSSWAQPLIDRWSTPYPLTLEHVAQYLATREDWAPIGTARHPSKCLLAQTLNWLYPQQAPWGVSPTTYGPLHTMTLSPSTYALQAPLLLSPELVALVECFDHFKNSYEDRQIRKIELREYLQFLERNALHRLPCPVTALFPEREQERWEPMVRREDRLYQEWIGHKNHWYDTYPVMHSYPKTVINWATATDVFAKEALGEPTPEFFSIASVLEEIQATMETAETEKKKELEPEQLPVLELALA